MTTGHTLTHTIAAPLEVIPADLGIKAQDQAAAMAALAITDAATMEAGNGLLMAAHATLKELEAARVKLKKPITELGKAIDGVVAKVSDPLDQAKRLMLGKVSAYQRQVQEEADRARREAEAKAAAERAAAEAERARLQAEADAKAKAEADELAAITGTVVQPEAVTVELPKPAAPAPAPVIPAVPKAAVQTRKVQKVEITDRMLVPVHVGGRVLRPIDERAVMEALKAGAVIPGARLIEVETLAMGRV
jgi:ribosomal protein L9